MLERTGKTNLSQEQKVDLDKERLQLEATLYLDKAAEEYEKYAMEDYDEICVNEDGSECPVLKCDFKDAFKAGAEWMAGQFQKIEGELVDWYSTSDGKDYCCGVKTDEAFEVPEGFYIRKK